NSNPVSTKTIARIVGNTAEANNPCGPIQYIGSRMLGIATTVVITAFKIPAVWAGVYQPPPGLACGRPEPVAILMGTSGSARHLLRRRTHAHCDARRLRRDAATCQGERVRLPGDQLHLLGNH